MRFARSSSATTARWTRGGRTCARRRSPRAVGLDDADWDERRVLAYLGDAQNTFPVWNATPLVLRRLRATYFLDYQTDRASYVDAFFENLDWDVVNGWIASYSIPS